MFIPMAAPCWWARGSGACGCRIRRRRKRWRRRARFTRSRWRSWRQRLHFYRGIGCGCGPKDTERGAGPRCRLDVDPPAMIGDDPPALAQPKSETSPGVAPGIKWVEKMGQVRFAKAAPVIRDDCDGKGTFTDRRSSHARPHLPRRRGHCVEAVPHNFTEHHVELGRIGCRKHGHVGVKRQRAGTLAGRFWLNTHCASSTGSPSTAGEPDRLGKTLGTPSPFS